MRQKKEHSDVTYIFLCLLLGLLTFGIVKAGSDIKLTDNTNAEEHIFYNHFSPLPKVNLQDNQYQNYAEAHADNQFGSGLFLLSGIPRSLLSIQGIYYLIYSFRNIHQTGGHRRIIDFIKKADGKKWWIVQNFIQNPS